MGASRWVFQDDFLMLYLFEVIAEDGQRYISGQAAQLAPV